MKNLSVLDMMARRVKPSTTYLLTVEGNYYASVIGGLAEKPYKAGFVTTENLLRKKTAEYQFKNAVAPSIMKDHFGDYNGLVTYHVTSAKVINSYGEATGEDVFNIDLMQREELELLCADMELDVKPNLYPDRKDLINAVKENILEPDKFVENQKRRELRKADILVMKSELLKLNKNFAFIDVTGDLKREDENTVARQNTVANYDAGYQQALRELAAQGNAEAAKKLDEQRAAAAEEGSVTGKASFLQKLQDLPTVPESSLEDELGISLSDAAELEKSLEDEPEVKPIDQPLPGGGVMETRDVTPTAPPPEPPQETGKGKGKKDKNALPDVPGV